MVYFDIFGHMKNITTILSYTVLSGLFLVLFIPFLVPTTMFFPFITGKGFAFRVLIEVVFSLYLILAFYDREYRPKDSWITRSVLVFTSVVFVADILGMNPSKSLWSNYERMEGFVLIAHLLLFYITTSSVLRNFSDWKKYFNVSIAASVIMSLYAVGQLLGKVVINQGGSRLDATLGNATYFAIYLVFHIFLALYYLLHETSKNWHKYIYGLVIILEVVILYYTATRGALLGLVGGVLVTGTYLAIKERENKFYRKLSYGLLSLVVVIIVGFIAIKDTEFAKTSPVLSRFRTIGLAEIKTQGRYYVWPMAIKGFQEHPVLGWGQEGFNYVFNKYYNPAMYGQEEWFDRSHNVFLDWLIAGGLLGLLAYLSLYVATLYYVIFKGQSVRVSDRGIILGMVCAYVFHNMFVFDNLISYIMFFSILAFVHSVYSDDLGGLRMLRNKNFSIDFLNYAVTPIILVVLISTIYLVNGPAYFANQTLIKALSPQKNIEVNLDLFKKAYAYNSFGFDEITEQVVQAAVNLPKNASEATKTDFQDLAEKKIREKIVKTPHDARYLVFAGSFFDQIGKYDDGLYYLKKAQEESPNKQSILLEIGSNYLIRGDIPTMQLYFRKAYDLKPTNSESIKILMLGSIYAKDQKTIQDLQTKMDQRDFIYDDRFLKAFLSIADYSSSLVVLNQRLKDDPTNVQNNLTIASVYATVGQKDKAIEHLRKIGTDHPEYKSEIENYISQLK